MTILAAQQWKNNAELVADLFELGYLDDDVAVLDPTFEGGKWWTVRTPAQLVGHRFGDQVLGDDGELRPWDFTDTHYPDDYFDRIAYDPPYVAKGGRKTSGIVEMDERYGQVDCPATPALLQELIDNGLTEMHRICRPDGLVFVKCQDYVSSGKLWPGSHLTLTHALELDFELVDRLEHVKAAPGPQPPGRRQVHARRNVSTLFVLRKLTARQAAKRAEIKRAAELDELIERAFSADELLIVDL